jgi:DNA-binding CsgD family transcriptional regulator
MYTSFALDPGRQAESARPPLDRPSAAARQAAAATARSFADWPQSILDELDHGIVLLGPDQHLVLMNRAAEAVLAGTPAVAMLSRQLRARSPQDAQRLQDALHAATERGLRRLLAVGSGDQRISLAVVPLGDERMAPPYATMVMFGKRLVCEQLSVQWFAQSHGLTPAETRVLARLAGGASPREIADEHEVGLSTVRTQIGAIRVKTGTDSIRELLRQVAVLPPMVGRLR